MVKTFPIDFSNFFPDKKEKILLALSGGADSICLLFLLKEEGYRVSAAHVNYGLRADESDDDEAFCRDICRKWNVELFVEKASISAKENIQAKAREIRYRFFEKLSATHGFSFIATAHHANDRFESLLLNLAKGCGPYGFLGMPEKNGKIIRPLLSVSRPEIENFCAQNELKYRQDSSNQSLTYKRNLIRHRIQPHFDALHPGAIDNYIRSTHHLEQLLNYFREAYQQFLDKELQIENETEKISAQHRMHVFFAQWLAEKGFDAAAIQHICSPDNAFKAIDGPGGTLIMHQGFFIFKPKSEAVENEFLSIDEVGTYSFMGREIEISIIEEHPTWKEGDNYCYFADAEALHFPLLLRKIQTGDKMSLWGMPKGQKKISDILSDAKWNRFQKEKAFVLCKDDTILWLCGLRRSEAYAIRKESGPILRICLT